VDEIEIFLKYPNLFQSVMRTNGNTIGLSVTPDVNTTVHCPKSNENTPYNVVESDTLTWGTAADRGSRNDYRARQSLGHQNVREVSLKQIKQTGNSISGGYVRANLRVKKQERINYPGEAQYWNQTSGFRKIVSIDSQNMAFLETLPELKDALRTYALETQRCWVDTRNSPNTNWENFRIQVDQPKRLIPINLTLDQAAELNKKHSQVLSLLAKEKLSEYTVRTHDALGMYSNREIPEHVYSHNGNSTWQFIRVAQEKPLHIKSWQSKSQLELDSQEVAIIGKTSYTLPQDFEVDVEFSTDQEFQLCAVLAWQRFTYTSNCTIQTRRQGRFRMPGTSNNNQYRETTKHTVIIPVVSGLIMRAKPIAPEGGWEGQRQIESLARVRNRTQKRQVRGGYKGPYQGISKISRVKKDGGFIKTTFQIYLSDGLAAIASKPGIKKFTVEGQKRLPMTRESFEQIERPMTNVKPIEIGHLELFRISEPPRKQVTGEILSDMQLPSMPEMLLAIDSDIRVSSHEEHYITGEQCSGTCDKSETIDVTVPPGLYVVRRKDKCVLRHDPGRKEYNAGFGNICNEIITIRRLLSHLRVFYDEFRGNMVGQESNVDWSSYDEESSGSLLGRF